MEFLSREEMVAQGQLVLLLVLAAFFVTKSEDLAISAGIAHAESLVAAPQPGADCLDAAGLGVRSLLGKRKKRRRRRSRKPRIALKNKNSSVSEDGATITVQNNSLLRSRDEPVSNVFNSSPLINNIADVNFNVSGDGNRIDTSNR
ncbi:hypothetical protein BSKO_03383 [Bryopsis sp. KO-2023]|nr:hypothetical protein BSKO_03383 [Bryopsis sp. KO-2023]